jgi:hypothetical protein
MSEAAAGLDRPDAARRLAQLIAGLGAARQQNARAEANHD